MVKLHASQPTQPANSVSVSFGYVGSISAPDALTFDQIVDIVCDTYSRYKKEKGALPRLKTIGGTRAPSSSNGSTLASKQVETIATLQHQIAKQSEEQEKSQKMIEALLQALNKHIPNFNFHPPLSSSS
ncbi:hypothetical protein TorRG33x02_219140 [Trema orientale]|uniref:Uncharacterized protein n=1 Tax=Trema orientale TaxID=63057 RepID=A0A2P5E9S5_TREOI|nr:hypothetical protein TorRG33x02_219140 [Trema orientale]